MTRDHSFKILIAVGVRKKRVPLKYKVHDLSKEFTMKHCLIFHTVHIAKLLQIQNNLLLISLQQSQTEVMVLVRMAKDKDKYRNAETFVQIC